MFIRASTTTKNSTPFTIARAYYCNSTISNALVGHSKYVDGEWVVVYNIVNIVDVGLFSATDNPDRVSTWSQAALP